MKLITVILLFSVVHCVQSKSWFRDCAGALKQIVQGIRDIWRFLGDLRRGNLKNLDTYFHARGSSDAAQSGPAGEAKAISDGRELQFGSSGKDSKADQFVNEWGRSGKDSKRFRPAGLDPKY
ncbi:serum amyloid A protein-like [Antechinus flavipes]|uniref:serum amyloid A protein-like n=1 Tax=Antechinus flavipes TaxID=38775 RepID=UPI0022367025|nr:serum amyloid A protein-like [Antechinus flavipes]